MRILTALMGVLFVAGLMVQYNDPDPLRWIAAYSAATLVSIQALRGKISRWQPALVGAAAWLWTATLAVNIEWQVLGRMFDSFEMQSVAVEEAREAVGMGIIAAWNVVLAWKPEAAGPRTA